MTISSLLILHIGHSLRHRRSNILFYQHPVFFSLTHYLYRSLPTNVYRLCHALSWICNSNFVYIYRNQSILIVFDNLLICAPREQYSIANFDENNTQNCTVLDTAAFMCSLLCNVDFFSIYLSVSHSFESEKFKQMPE